MYLFGNPTWNPLTDLPTRHTHRHAKADTHIHPSPGRQWWNLAILLSDWSCLDCVEREGVRHGWRALSHMTLNPIPLPPPHPICRLCFKKARPAWRRNKFDACHLLCSAAGSYHFFRVWNWYLLVTYLLLLFSIICSSFLISHYTSIIMFVAKIACHVSRSNSWSCYCVVAAEQGINILPLESSAAWNILQILYIVQRLEGYLLEQKNKQCTALVCLSSLLAMRHPPSAAVFNGGCRDAPAAQNKTPQCRLLTRLLVMKWTRPLHVSQCSGEQQGQAGGWLWCLTWLFLLRERAGGRGVV